MKDKILKLTGHKDLKSFYDQFPTEESFIAKYGAKLKKAGLGDMLKGVSPETPGKLIQGFQKLKAEKEKRKSLDQWADVTGLVSEVAGLRSEEPERKYVRPEDVVNSGEEFFPIYGVGTNVLKHGGEIQNTYAPNTLYDDLEYTPLKKAVNGEWMKGTPFGEYAEKYADPLSNLISSIGGENAGGDIGGTIGETAGTMLGGPIGGFVGKLGGQAIGALIDRNPAKIKKARKEINQNIGQIGMMNNIAGVQQQYSSFMEEGGQITNPQLITKFGEHSVKDLLDLRTGGNIRQNSTSELDDYAFGGDLKVYNGEAEPISYNPYTESETIMFRGPSHENGGMPIKYGNSPVEVEGGEPAVKMKDGGNSESLVVFGNLQIPNGMLEDPNAKGKKFKNYIADLAKTENRANKTMTSSLKMIDEIDAATSFDKLKLSSLKANIMGSEMKLKDIADKKEKAANIQNAINQTAEEQGLLADDLAKGKITKAKYGKKMAANGIQDFKFSTERPKQSAWDATRPMNDELTYYPSEFEVDAEEDIKPEDWMMKEELFTGKKDKKKFDWEKAIDKGLTAAKSMVPYLRPSDVEDIDPRQYAAELSALTDDVEPVYAQTRQPKFVTPQNISLQDILNENIADFRATEKLLANNPAALAMLNAQKYAANQKVLGEQFRMNQAEKQRVAETNRLIQDEVEKQNLQILDTQQYRQALAKSKTKAVTRKALESISNKYLQNQLENRKLQAYENLYNYRFDEKGRAINMNAPYEWNLSGNKPYSNDLPKNKQYSYTMDEFGNLVKEDIKAKPKSRNGSIVRALKNF